MTFTKGHPRYGGMQRGQVVSIKREAFERLRTVAMDAAGDVGYDELLHRSKPPVGGGSRRQSRRSTRRTSESRGLG
jgi:hypothetical protein